MCCRHRLMAESKRIAWLVGVMMAVVIAATATSIGVDYRTAFERERQHLSLGRWRRTNRGHRELCA